MGSIGIFQLFIFLTIIISPFIIIYKFKNNEKNRINREDFIPRFIISFICSMFAIPILFPFGLFLFLGLYVYMLILIMKRINDLDKNPSLLLLCFLPIINIILILYLSFSKNVDQITNQKK